MCIQIGCCILTAILDGFHNVGCNAVGECLIVAGQRGIEQRGDLFSQLHQLFDLCFILFLRHELGTGEVGEIADGQQREAAAVGSFIGGNGLIIHLCRSHSQCHFFHHVVIDCVLVSRNIHGACDFAHGHGHQVGQSGAENLGLEHILHQAVQLILVSKQCVDRIGIGIVQHAALDQRLQQRDQAVHLVAQIGRNAVCLHTGDAVEVCLTGSLCAEEAVELDQTGIGGSIDFLDQTGIVRRHFAEFYHVIDHVIDRIRAGHHCQHAKERSHDHAENNHTGDDTHAQTGEAADHALGSRLCLILFLVAVVLEDQLAQGLLSEHKDDPGDKLQYVEHHREQHDCNRKCRQNQNQLLQQGCCCQDGIQCAVCVHGRQNQFAQALSLYDDGVCNQGGHRACDQEGQQCGHCDEHQAYHRLVQAAYQTIDGTDQDDRYKYCQ